MNETLSPGKLASEGKAAYQRRDFIAAARAFEAAAQGYASEGDALNAAEIANNSSVAYLQAGDGPSALRLAEGTAAVFGDAGDARRQGMALGNLAAALEAINRLDEAAEAYQQSAGLLQHSGDDAAYANVMQSLSALQLRTGRQLEALATMQSGLEKIKRPSPKQRFLKQLLRVPFRLLNR